jgi:hypothetical protein
VGSVTPFILATEGNPSGAPQEVFDEPIDGGKSDRPWFLENFLADVFNLDEFEGDRNSSAQVHYSHRIATQHGVGSEISGRQTDFRDDLRKADVPAVSFTTAPTASSR